jgi:large subunit ribosomal protein L25
MSAHACDQTPLEASPGAGRASGLFPMSARAAFSMSARAAFLSEFKEHIMSAVKQISAAARTQVGKGAARAVRREGRIPAVVYGAGEAPTPVSLDRNETNLLVYAGHFLTTVFELEIDGRKTRVIPRDYQLDPLKDIVEHVDFLRVSAGARIRVDVPVHAVNAGQSPGVKRGGSINIVTHAISLMVPADDIPESVDVDISALDINASVHLADITLPKGATTTLAGDVTLVSIVPPTVELAPAATDCSGSPFSRAVSSETTLLKPNCWLPVMTAGTMAAPPCAGTGFTSSFREEKKPFSTPR